VKGACTCTITVLILEILNTTSTPGSFHHIRFRNTQKILDFTSNPEKSNYYPDVEIANELLFEKTIKLRFSV